ncbi:phosphotransferase enzyme family protein [Paracnuella aquatica]|uniref:phosphotransferase enzyme family protein n=1 Tax=Paracnuella aquatica TaxID=2268757 RepID=UPI000DF01EF4|nr:aminoglycoside phosphotransferase family protein [Paracnuella aquatica]RPD45583.1 aminoglycoside phosphotransferase family protein [Paracnuella aquatica]
MTSHSILPSYGLQEQPLQVEAFGSGLINSTWKVTTAGREYILQKVNDAIFTRPEKIAHNVRMIAGYLQQHHPDYLFIAPIAANDGAEMIYRKGEGFFRLFPFVPHSHSFDVVETPGQAFEAAAQFGRFTRMLTGMDTSGLEITLPEFHNLNLRYQQFREAQEKGNSQRITACRWMIEELEGHAGIVERFEQIKNNPEFKLRVTHHDTKISNVLFDAQGKGICVIDLDTAMPGYFISDVGDMMRTYLSPVSEEEADYSKIEVRDDFYKAIVAGYYGEMKDELTATEQGHFFYAGLFMIYMQALRFLTDYLNNDQYYGARYPDQNKVRAGNQLCLLQRLLEKRELYEGDAFCG